MPTAQRATHAKQKKAEITFAAIDYCHIVRTVQFCCRLDLPAQLKLLLSFMVLRSLYELCSQYLFNLPRVAIVSLSLELHKFPVILQVTNNVFRTYLLVSLHFARSSWYSFPVATNFNSISELLNCNNTWIWHDLHFWSFISFCANYITHVLIVMHVRGACKHTCC